ncbi:lethal(3)malignant brain tumor-like protein 3 isoform X3 [Monodelphis domestica]|uniref:lethal(3)malignant brain tumor-like protein 3 isoform X3 n=1 Tax=Monodelphis domestica TaxID=13616 RepID=UPI0024E1E1EC|nr:lethal(3)malignant brain tumor-like protein 3 isoform X3 [Monodelphis domestica]
MNEPASSTSGQEFDVFSVMDWKDGVGTLPGSDLKFRVNEFGALEVITDETEIESVKKATATTTWMVPTAQEVFSEKTGVPFRLKETMKVEGLQFCENCYQYGTVDEFLSGGKFCSQKCARQNKDNREQKEEKDVGEDNEEDDSKCSRKRKAKLPLRVEPKEDGEEREDENRYSFSSEDCFSRIPEILENKHDGRILRGSQRARRKRRNDSTVLKQSLPPKGKKAWCWASYLEEEKAIAVPTKLFKEYQSFPYNKNGFKVGMKLEGVDPEHQSMYCVLTVAEVCGYRIKLHFDGYPDCYDFWVNADALDIHPVGWCEKTGHKLHPPKGYKEEEFNWQTYLKTCKAQAAPKSLFENQNTTVIPSGFRVGMKLEAVDKKNPAFICVATVTDMVDNRFLVHFDNWDESYDYWCEAASPHIHPVGWCKEHRRTLITPPDYPNVKHFSWDKYLEETNSLPAPARAFKVKPAHGFQKKMKFEIVDKRNPVFVRVATVTDTDEHRIKVHFDGWSNSYDYWIEADSPDIHPVGWCAKTGHPLQPPLSPLELVEASEQGGCPTAGCKGIGHIKRARHPGSHREQQIEEKPIKEECEEGIKSEVRTPNQTKGIGAEPSSQQAQRRSAVFLSFKSPIPCLPLRWEQQSKLLPTVAGIPASKVSKWSTDEVSEFIQSLPGCEEHGKVFKDEQIDGEAFLLMTQTDIVKIMSIKLGPALKIFNSILMFKAAEKNSHNEL